MHIRHIAVPDLVGIFGQLDARCLALAAVVEEAELDPRRVRREQREVDPLAVPGGSPRMRLALADRAVVLVGLARPTMSASGVCDGMVTTRSRVGEKEEMGGAMKTSDDPLELEPVRNALPVGFDALRAEALAEGFRQVERLASDWEAGRTRFDRPGEALLATRLNGALVGIGGLTIEPVVPGALRMRRFYVRPAFRRHGVGRQLVTALLAGANGDRSITVNAAPASIAFWESLGFSPDPRDGRTHILSRERV